MLIELTEYGPLYVKEDDSKPKESGAPSLTELAALPQLGKLAV